MKNLKEYIVEGIFDIEDNIDNVDESIREEIKHFLKDNFDGASSCKISNKPNRDGKYEVSSNGNIMTENRGITSLTNGLFIWTYVKGDFDCTYCKSLTSLEGAPKEVGRDFRCSACTSLTSLEGAPKEVGGDFDCDFCKSLTSLKGAPEKVGKDFYCGYCNSLTSLEGAPEKVGKDFYCGYCNSLTSLKGAPKVVSWNFNCHNCTSLTSLEGAPEKVGWNFNCIHCKAEFTEEDVKKVSNVKGTIDV